MNIGQIQQVKAYRCEVARQLLILNAVPVLWEAADTYLADAIRDGWHAEPGFVIETVRREDGTTDHFLITFISTP